MSKTKNRLGVWPLYSLVGVFLLLFGGFGYVAYESTKEAAEVAAFESETIAKIDALATNAGAASVKSTDADSVADLYPNTKPMKIRDIDVQASVAKTWPERIQGLSNTPYLPEDTVKLFIFDSSGMHSFWMKDMNYSIDILWVSEAGEIVHIEEQASPESYPAMFVPKTEARYVIETVAGFVQKHAIIVGEMVVLPTL